MTQDTPITLPSKSWAKLDNECFLPYQPFPQIRSFFNGSPEISRYSMFLHVDIFSPRMYLSLVELGHYYSRNGNLHSGTRQLQC